MFESLSPIDRSIVYDALMYAISHDFREAFHNLDTGHPVYGLGGDAEFHHAYGPEKNILFKLMHELSRYELESDEQLIHQPVLCWGDFCRIVSEAHEKIANGVRDNSDRLQI